MSNRLVDDPRFQESRLVDNQRNVERRLVRKQTVRHLAVLGERFSMVARYDDERSAAGALVEDPRQERRQRGIRRGYFAQIRRGFEPRGEWFRRRVREMRLVNVDPRKPFSVRRRDRTRIRPRSARIAVDPSERRTNRIGARALRHVERRLVSGLAVAIVVDIESTRQPEPYVEWKRADECAGSVAAPLQQRRQRIHFGWKSEPGVVADTVGRRISARQNARVRRQRHDAVCVSAREPHTGLCEPID